MGVPGLTSCTTKYQVTRDKDGKVVTNRNTYEFSSTARKNLSGATRSTTFSSSNAVRPTRTYATGANSRLGKYGYEMGPDGKIRSNLDFSDLRAGNGTGASRPTVITISAPSNSGCCAAPASGGNNIGDIAAAATNLYSVLNQVGAIDAIKNAFSSDGVTGTPGGNPPAGTDSLAQMKDCKDSTSLRGAIETATADKAQMQSDLEAINGSLDAKKTAAEASEKKAETLEENIGSKQDEIKGLKTNLSEAQTSLKACESAKASALKELEKADKGLADSIKAEDNAKQNVSKAETNLSNAETTLANTPKSKTGPDGKTSVPNEPAYSNAQKAVENAKTELRKAQDALKAAQDNRANAEKNFDTKDLANKNAIEQYNKQDELCQKYEKSVKEKEPALKQAQSDLKKLQDDLKDENGIINDYKKAKDQKADLEDQIKKYENEIKDQQKRLDKLADKEAKELESTNKEITKRFGNISDRNEDIDVNDGKSSLKEKRAMNKNSKDAEKLQELQAKRDDLQRKVNYTKLAGTNGIMIGTKAFKTGTFGNETLYMIGSKAVTQAEFEAQKKIAEEAMKKEMNGVA